MGLLAIGDTKSEAAVVLLGAIVVVTIKVVLVAGVVGVTVAGISGVESPLVIGTRTVTSVTDCVFASSERINVAYMTLAIKLAATDIPSRMTIPLGVNPPPELLNFSQKALMKSITMRVYRRRALVIQSGPSRSSIASAQLSIHSSSLRRTNEAVIISPLVSRIFRSKA